jgi:hypothetical protein
MRPNRFSRTPSPGTPTAQVSRGPLLKAYGVRTTNIPAVLTQPGGVTQALHDFGGGRGDTGTGVKVAGLLLTARHVPTTRIAVRVTPPPGSFTYGGVSELYFGDWNDWKLLDDPSGTRDASTTLRATSSLKPGEPLWVLGDKTGASFRVSMGNLGEIKGANARLENIDLEPGFSGGPVVDAFGNVVGIAVAMFEGRVGWMVTTDAIAEVVNSERKAKDRSLPMLKLKRRADTQA